MSSALLSFLLILIGFPDLNLRWDGAGRQTLTVQVREPGEAVDQCLKSGFKISYRFEVRLCRKRKWWRDRCSDERTETRLLEYDPISESYNIVTDIHGDADDPSSTHESSLFKARESAATLSGLRVSDIKDDDTASGPARRYVSVRVLSECKGEYNPILAKIPYVLTLGIVRISGYNSGWQDLALEQ